MAVSRDDYPCAMIEPCFVILNHPSFPRILVADRAELLRNSVLLNDEILHRYVGNRAPDG